MASFARGLRDDKSGVMAALSLPWSNGQTEGQITKLKLVDAGCSAEPSSISWARLLGAA